MFLLLIFIVAGAMAVDTSVHYRLKNSSVCLHVQQPPPYKTLQWTFDQEVISFGGKISSQYEKKAELKPNQTLCLSELTEADTGIYEVLYRYSDTERFTERHSVIVQEAVTRPVLRMSVVRSNLSAGLCDYTANCSIQQDWVWVVCSENSCRTSQWSLSKVNISISTDNRMVICSGYNHVSTSNVTKRLNATCFRSPDAEYHDAEYQIIIVAVIAIIVTAVFVSLCACIYVMKAAYSKVKQDRSQTETSNVQPVEPEPRPRMSSSSSADVAYENIDDTRRSSSPTTNHQEQPGSQQQVDTVYSLVQAQEATASVDQSIREETSQAVYQHEEQEPSSRHIDTVYSVLQKPKPT